MKSYAISSTLIKDIKKGMNIACDLRMIHAVSKEEAIKKYVLEINDQYPEHYIHVGPLAMEIEQHQ